VEGLNQGRGIGLLGTEQNNLYLFGMHNYLVNGWKLPKIGRLREYGALGTVYTPAIDELALIDVIGDLGDLPFDIIQIDNGWQVAIGDWEPNNKFSAGMDRAGRKDQN